MFKKILIASDGSEGAAKAFDAALALARQYKAELTMICVEELPSFPSSMDEMIEEKKDLNGKFNRITGHARAKAKEAQVKFDVHLTSGHVVPKIVNFIERKAIDLLIIGFMGHSALYNRVIGGTTNRLVQLAPCPVLVVK